jgi:hypothetical protein
MFDMATASDTFTVPFAGVYRTEFYATMDPPVDGQLIYARIIYSGTAARATCYQVPGAANTSTFSCSDEFRLPAGATIQLAIFQNQTTRTLLGNSNFDATRATIRMVQ